MGIGAFNIDLNVGKIGKVFKDLRSALTGKADPTRVAELNAELDKIETSLKTAQADINKIEAGHASIFVAGWRPYIGWIIGTCIGIYFIPTFGVGMFIWAKAVLASGEWISPPEIDIGQLVSLLLSMMCMVGARTLEKKWGVQKNH